MHTITFLPPGPDVIRYDEHQFRKSARMVSAESHISFGDRHAMHFDRHASRRAKRYIPPFGFDNKKLARVLAIAAWRRSHGGVVPCPENISFLQLRTMSHKRSNELRSEDVSHLTAKQRAIRERMYVSIDAAGGYLELITRISYLSWRLGYESTRVAEACIGCTPQQVRIILCRLSKIARSLGYDAPVTAAPGSIAKEPRARKRNGRFRWSSAMLDKARRMRKAGSTLQAIADALGLATCQQVSCKLHAKPRTQQRRPRCNTRTARCTVLPTLCRR
jgi:hypothetical protein